MRAFDVFHRAMYYFKLVERIKTLFHSTQLPFHQRYENFLRRSSQVNLRVVFALFQKSAFYQLPYCAVYLGSRNPSYDSYLVYGCRSSLEGSEVALALIL